MELTTQFSYFYSCIGVLVNALLTCIHPICILVNLRAWLPIVNVSCELTSLDAGCINGYMKRMQTPHTAY